MCALAYLPRLVHVWLTGMTITMSMVTLVAILVPCLAMYVCSSRLLIQILLTIFRVLSRLYAYVDMLFAPETLHPILRPRRA